MGATLEVSDTGGGVRVLTVSNPTRRNALDPGLLEALASALATPDPVRAWLVRGAGDETFCAGYDLQALQGHQAGQRLPDERLGEVLDLLGQHPAPSVALVTGAAIGAGCELAVACDFRVGDVRARFAMPPARLGVVYALKGLQRLQARVGEGFARYLFLTGRRVDASQAHARGLLDLLAVDAPAEALALCAELAGNAPLAVAGLKRGLALLEDAGGTAADRAAYQALRQASFVSEDAREGVRAALEKRAPRFQGR
jgi:enoyl-CoA hydratase/carnithine racemase